LGIIGHYLDAGEIDMQGYRRSEWTSSVSMRQHERPGAPAVDLDLMKKFIDLEERDEQEESAQVCIVAVSESGQVASSTQPQARFDGAGIPLDDLGLRVTSGDHIVAGAPEKQVLLITSEYRFFLRTLQHLADLAEVNMSLAAMESFYADQFGHESVTALVDWQPVLSAQRLMLISNKGEAKIVRADMLLPNLAQTYPYQMERIAGEPVALVPADQGELILITNQGSVLRLKPADLSNGTQRIMRLRKDEEITQVLVMPAPAEIVLTTTAGQGKRLHTRALDIANSAAMGLKTLSGRDLSTCVVLQPDAAYWAITTRQICPLTFDTIPLDAPTPPHKHALLRLQPGEELVALRSFSEL
jgi:DNA gyrase/topoisomerase IV subunit A